MDVGLEGYGNGIYALDSGYLRPRLDAIHLIVEKERVAIIDTGTFRSVPRIEAALSQLGLSFASVDFVVLTHVHLDHAGGAGELMRRCAGAQLVVHPRGAQHMIDPTKLWAGTVGVYGEARARADYGELIPVVPSRLIAAPDGFSLRLAGRELHFVDTPGHAKHHFCVHDPATASLFTGDTFGLSYRELDRYGKQFIFPTTTPVQFDPSALVQSVDRLLALRPDSIFLTHYSRIQNVPDLGRDLRRLIHAHAQLAERVEDTTAPDGWPSTLRRGVEEMVTEEARQKGGEPAHWLRTFSNDIELNAAGLQAWLEARRRKS